MSTFNIDFFELIFLAEICIPPKPIARTMFWHNLIDQHYQAMSEDEKIQLFQVLNDNKGYKDELSQKQPDVVLFHRRFNPDNQYLINTKEGEFQCFFHNGKYHVKKDIWIDFESITNITKMP